MQANVDLIKQLYEYLATNDKESYLKLCDDNIEWLATKDATHGLGKCSGKKEIFEEFLPRFYSNFKEFRGIPEEFLDAGENVVVLGKYHIVSKTGESFKASFASIFTIKDDKIIRFRNYADSATIQSALPEAREFLSEKQD